MKSVRELGAHGSWEVVQSKLLGGQARELPVPGSFPPLSPETWVYFLQRQPLLGNLTCGCSGPDLHRVEGSTPGACEKDDRCFKLRAERFTQNRSKIVLILFLLATLYAELRTFNL